MRVERATYTLMCSDSDSTGSGASKLESEAFSATNEGDEGEEEEDGEDGAMAAGAAEASSGPTLRVM